MIMLVSVQSLIHKITNPVTASKYGVFSGPYFPVFKLNTRKYGPEKNPFLDTFHAVSTAEGVDEIERLLLENVTENETAETTDMKS